MSIKQKLINYALHKTIGDLPMGTVRRRLYDNIIPRSYDNFYNRFKNAVINNEKEQGDILSKFTTKNRDEIWAEYLCIPKNQRHNISDIKVENANYKPTKGNQNIDYKKLSDNAVNRFINSKGEISYYNGTYRTSNAKNLIDDAFGIPIPIIDEYGYPTHEFEHKGYIKLGQNKLSKSLVDYFGEHTIGRGLDSKNGEYVSYYDLWDLAPQGKYGEDQSNGIGKPINFYDRIYLDDYYEIPKDKRKPNKNDGYYGGYLPELVVKPRKSLKE